MSISRETVMTMARELYGLEISEERAAELAIQATDMTECAHRSGVTADFNEELMSARQVLIRAVQDGDAS